MKKAYLAGTYGRRAELHQVALDLLSLNVEITARWLGGGHEMDYEPAKAAQFAAEDLEDVAAADTVIVFSGERQGVAPTRGGRHTEFGAAVATGKNVILVGPRECVFHHLASVRHFPTWEAALAAIKKDVV